MTEPQPKPRSCCICGARGQHPVALTWRAQIENPVNRRRVLRNVSRAVCAGCAMAIAATVREGRAA